MSGLEEKQVSKEPLLPHTEDNELSSTPSSTSSRTSRILRCRAAKYLFVTLTTLYALFVINHIYHPLCRKQGQNVPSEPDTPHRDAGLKVPLEAHIMSKCPDAQDCLRDLVVPAMEEIADKVDFRLSYIGRPDGNGVECMHGPDECLGNIIQLCAAHLYPNPKTHLGFTMCMMNDYHHIPEQDLLHDCALEHGIDFDELNECASKDEGTFGMEMLRKSVTRTAEANVTKSCTVRLDESIRCIRDGGEWKSCVGGHHSQDLIRDVKDLSAAYAAGA